MRRHAVVVGSLTLVCAAVSLLREQATAFWFGAGPVAEAFVIAYAVPAFVVNMSAGVLGPVFTPLLLRIRFDGGRDAERAFTAAALTANAVLAVFVTVLLGLGAPVVLSLLAPGFDAARMAVAVQLLYLLLPIVVFSNLANFWAALLNADQRFGTAAIAPALPPIGGVLGLVVDGTRHGAYAMAGGLTVGTALQAALLAWAAHRGGHATSFGPPRASAQLPLLAGQYGTLLLASVLLGATTLVSQSMATSISPGAVAHLGFANVPVLFVLGLGARTIGQVLLPHFSSLAAEQDWAALRSETRRALRATWLVSIPAAIGLMLVAEPASRLLFERGAFLAQDTVSVAGIQRILALQIPWYIGGIVTARLLTALQLTRQMLGICAASLLLTVGLNAALRPVFGVRGIALTTCLVYGFSFMAAWFLALRRLRVLESSA